MGMYYAIFLRILLVISPVKDIQQLILTAL